VNIKLTGNARATLPLSNGASLFFRNIVEQSSTFLQDFDFAIIGVISGSARADQTFFYRASVSNLPSKENVSAGVFVSVTGFPGILISNWSDGQFSPIGGSGSGQGFVGFRFNTGNGTQYGWARISTHNAIVNGRNHIRDNIQEYAWGDVGEVILTGQKQSLQPTNANSVPGSLGLLAFGAQGLDAWRTQRMSKCN
jgi:hypothetical protein